MILISIILIGCTENIRARSFGGETTINLPCDTKLFDVTWKNANLWYAVRKMKPNDNIETYDFIEDSSWGAFEGKVVFVEKRCK